MFILHCIIEVKKQTKMNFPITRYICASVISRYGCNTSKRCYSSSSLFQKVLCPRKSFTPMCSFHTSKCIKKQNENELYSIDKPFRYISQALQVLSKMRGIDEEFEEFEFLDGTKQAIIYVSNKVAEGNLNELDDLLTSNGADLLKKLYNEHSPKTSALKVEESEIVVVVPVSMTVEDDNAGKKWVYVLVDCCCKGGKIVRCSFCRNFGSDMPSSWLIDAFDYTEVR